MKSRYVSPCDSCVGQISATKALRPLLPSSPPPKKAKVFWWWTAGRAYSLNGVQVHWMAEHKLQVGDRMHISHSGTGSSQGTWGILFSRQVAEQKSQVKPCKHVQALYSRTSTTFRWPKRITEPSPSQWGQWGVRPPGGTAVTRPRGCGAVTGRVYHIGTIIGSTTLLSWRPPIPSTGGWQAKGDCHLPVEWPP